MSRLSTIDGVVEGVGKQGYMPGKKNLPCSKSYLVNMLIYLKYLYFARTVTYPIPFSFKYSFKSNFPLEMLTKNKDYEKK